MRRGGFTLVEVVASLLLASVTLVAVLNLIVTNMKSGQINNQRLAAFSLLIEKLEDARAKGFSAFVADAGNVGGYSYVVVETFSYLGNAYLKKVDVSVSWNTPAGANQSETVSTLLADY